MLALNPLAKDAKNCKKSAQLRMQTCACACVIRSDVPIPTNPCRGFTSNFMMYVCVCVFSFRCNAPFNAPYHPVETAET